MTLIVYMAAVGGLEAVAYLWRYRSAGKPSHWSSAASSGAVQIIRDLGIGGVAHALDSEEIQGVTYAASVLAYVVVPVAVTAWTHRFLEQRTTP